MDTFIRKVCFIKCTFLLNKKKLTKTRGTKNQYILKRPEVKLIN